MPVIFDIFSTTFDFVVASTPSLLLGFFLAGLLHVFVPADRIPAIVGKPGFRSVLIASLVGLPIPLCSCAVIPVAISLRVKGASRGATASFLISTPEIGIDSFLLSYSLLGGPLTWARVAAAFFSAFVVGMIIDLLRLDAEEKAEQQKSSSSCKDHCCEESVAARTTFSRLKTGMRYGFLDLADDLSGLLIVAFLLAGTVSALVPDNALSGLGPTSSLIAAFLISVPTYVCASASTPLAVAFMSKGLSPGAAMVFLLAGPASNIATIVAVKGRLGTRSLIAYLTGIAVVTLTAGVLVNAFSIPAKMHPSLHAHEHDAGSAILGGLFLIFIVWRWLKKRIKRS